MKIGVIGKGNIGTTLGRRWAQTGQQVMWGVRDPAAAAVTTLLRETGEGTRAGTVEEAAAWSDVVLLAVPWPAASEVLDQIAGALEGKILIDAVNALAPPLLEAPSVAEQIAIWAPGAQVVKAFNTTSYSNMANPLYGDLNADNFVCGDDEVAKQLVSTLSESIGLPVVDVGPLANAGLVESLGKLWITLAFSRGFGRDVTFKLLRR